MSDPKPRFPKAETRAKILAQAYDMYTAGELTPGDERMAAVLDKLDLTTGAAYQIWAQPKFRDDLALYIVNNLPPIEPNPRTDIATGVAEAWIGSHTYRLLMRWRPFIERTPGEFGAQATPPEIVELLQTRDETEIAAVAAVLEAQGHDTRLADEIIGLAEGAANRAFIPARATTERTRLIGRIAELIIDHTKAEAA